MAENNALTKAEVALAGYVANAAIVKKDPEAIRIYKNYLNALADEEEI